MAKLEEWALDGEEETRGPGENAELNAEKSRSRSHRDAVTRTKLYDEMNNELLDEIGAVSDAGDERNARNLFSTKRRTRTHGADEKRCHAKSYEWQLPNAHRHGDVVALTQIQSVSDRGQCRQPEPGRQVRYCYPPARPKFFDRGQSDAEDQWVESCPGGVVDPGLIGTETDACFVEILKGKERAES